MSEERRHDVPEPEPVEEPVVQETAADAREAEDERDPDRLMKRLMRLQAEYENYRKRVARERASWTAIAVESLLLDLLPVMDSFDRAIGSAEEALDVGTVLEGLELVKKQLGAALGAHGVTLIEALGEEFDPSVHEAFMSRAAEADEKPGTIVQEVLAGYRLGDRTLRATKGVVAVAPEESGSNSGSEEE